VAKKEDKRIFSVDILDLFVSGRRTRVGYDSDVNNFLSIDGNKLCYLDIYNKEMTIAIKLQDRFILIDGDEETIDRSDDFASMIADSSNSDMITVSFTCLKNAGIKDMNDMKVIGITTDTANMVYSGAEGFKDFESNAPQGATVRMHGESDNITWKSYHLAGSLLFEYKGDSYICGMDEDSYFISKLKTSPKSVNMAYKSLKPSRVVTYENKNNTRAQRQGEWFFIPCHDLIADDMKRNKALPHEKGGNEHVVREYEKHNERHYVKGDVCHPEHNDVYLNSKKALDGLHEAICNTAIGSWSVQGVD
jgi:hypothetical protein